MTTRKQPIVVMFMCFEPVDSKNVLCFYFIIGSFSSIYQKTVVIRYLCSFWKYLQSWLFNDMICQINPRKAKRNSGRTGKTTVTRLQGLHRDFQAIMKQRGEMGVGRRQRRLKPLAPIEHGGELFQLYEISQSRVSKASRSSVVSVLSQLLTSEASCDHQTPRSVWRFAPKP